MLWTITYNGTEKALADWGLTQAVRTRASQDDDTLSFVADGAATDAAPVFPIKSTLILQRDRVQDSGGVWSGGAIWFQGLVTQIPRRGDPTAESNSYKVSGPWWYLRTRVFEKVFHVFNGWTVFNDPTTQPTFITKTFSHCFLMVDQTVLQPDPTLGYGKLNTGQQIVEALQWALKPFTDASAAAPFQIGSVTPNLDVPIQEIRDITCAEAGRMCLRWSPDAVTWFDYTTNPPTFNCKRRADYAPVNVDIGSGNLVREIRVNPRYDLQSSFVLISYEQTQSINGVTWMQPVTDQFPALLPTDPLSSFNGLRFTVDLQGVNQTTTQATLVCAVINPTDPNWWLGRQPQYEPHDLGAAAEDGNAIFSIAFDFTTLERQPTNTGEIDKGWQNELQDGELTDWMTTFKSQRLTFTVKGTIVKRNGSIEPNHTFSYQLNSTNANSGTYKNTQISQYAEPLPIGLAQQLYNAVSVLQFEGEIVLQEENCSGILGIGQLFNLTGGAGALGEWSTMKGMVQRITENLDAGTTTIEFGPPPFISAGELVDLLRVNRFRKLSYSVGLALGQTSGGQTGVPLGKNTSEKNSASTPGFSQQHVVSGTIDGSGANVTSAAGFTQWAPAGPVNPAGLYPAGSVTISLADAAGATLKIQKFPVCQDGVEGTIYLLCSQFVPDP